MIKKYTWFKFFIMSFMDKPEQLRHKGMLGSLKVSLKLCKKERSNLYTNIDKLRRE